jgi:hypothetical protein
LRWNRRFFASLRIEKREKDEPPVVQPSLEDLLRPEVEDEEADPLSL